jgi:hypothetical protein
MHLTTSKGVTVVALSGFALIFISISRSHCLAHLETWMGGHSVHCGVLHSRLLEPKTVFRMLYYCISVPGLVA